MTAVHETGSTKNVYKKDNEGHWERVGKGDTKLDRSYDAHEKRRKSSQKKWNADAKAEAKAAAREARKEAKREEWESRACEMAARGIEDNPWDLMTTGLPPKSKNKSPKAPKPPKRPPPGIPRRDSSVSAVTESEKALETPVAKNRQRKKSEAAKSEIIQDDTGRSQYTSNNPSDASVKSELVQSGFTAAPRKRSSAGRFLPRSECPVVYPISEVVTKACE